MTALDEGGVISIGERLMSETMIMILNKRLQEIQSLSHYAFFPPFATQGKVGKQIMASFSYDGRIRRSYY
jgi:hypothetical protein